MPAEVIDTPDSTMTAVQAAFDRATKFKPKTEEKAAEPAPPSPPPPSKEEPKAIEPASEPIKEAAKVEDDKSEFKVPSFITAEPEKTEEKPPEPEIKLEDLPEEAPEGSDEKTKINWKNTRTLLKKQADELSELRQKQSQKQDAGRELSEADAARLKQLEDENTGMRQQLERVGLQNHPRFMQEIIVPMQQTYGEAKRIIKDAGGDPSALDRAVTLTGEAHYRAMDEILAELPESAKGEITTTMRDFRKLAQARSQAIANAPKALEELRRQDLIQQRDALDGMKHDMEKLFDERVSVFRDQLKFEPLIETTEKDAQGWNEIPKNVLATARKIALESQDPKVAMDASILAASAGTLRDLWLRAEKRVTAESERADKAEKELADIKGTEPTIRDSATISRPEKVDLDEPIGKAFIRELNRLNKQGIK